MRHARGRLTKDDWTAAGLEALIEGGVGAVAIEPLAKRLGATKGSAYWHFPNREALLRATLERWEIEHTERIIAMLEPEPDPKQRFRLLIENVMRHAGADAAELALLAAADDPVVAPVVARVSERRIGYLVELYRGLGLGLAESRRRAVVAYSVYLGHAQLARSAPDAVPRGRATLRAYIDELTDLLTPES